MKPSKLTWRRARDAFTITAITATGIATIGCIGVRDRLFEPLPTPNSLHYFAQSPSVDAPRVQVEPPKTTLTESNDPEARPMRAPGDVPPPPDTKLRFETHEDTEELLLELEDLGPLPRPIRLEGRTTVQPLEWRG